MSNFEKWLKEGKIIIDSGKIVILNATNILVPTRVLIYLFKLLEEKFGKEKSREIQIKMGEFQIAQALTRYKQLFEIEKIEKRKYLEMGTSIAEMLGLGIWKISENLAIVENNPIPTEYILMFEKSPEPIDYYLLGITRKVYESYFGKEVEVKETKCIACGDPYCEFQIIPLGKKSKT